MIFPKIIEWNYITYNFLARKKNVMQCRVSCSEFHVKTKSGTPQCHNTVKLCVYFKFL